MTSTMPCRLTPRQSNEWWVHRICHRCVAAPSAFGVALLGETRMGCSRGPGPRPGPPYSFARLPYEIVRAAPRCSGGDPEARQESEIVGLVEAVRTPDP
jgi:hypothetical protein